jgi:hypothetical protein
VLWHQFQNNEVITLGISHQSEVKTQNAGQNVHQEGEVLLVKGTAFILLLPRKTKYIAFDVCAHFIQFSE